MSLYYRSDRMIALGEGTWYSGTKLTNPEDGQVMIDTGALAAGRYLFSVHAAGSAAFVLDVQHRNADNDATVDSQERRAGAAGNDDFPFPNKITLAEGERLRVVLVGNLTGTLQVSIFAQEMP